MFRIADGRECFYQWDLDRKVIVEDDSITEVHFCNRTDNCSLVVEVEELEIFADAKPISVLRTANVPNIILQNSFDIRVFGYDGKATLHEKTFKVKPRTQPADYIYTETQVRTYDELIAKTEAAVTELYEYVEGHKLDFIDDGKGNIVLEAVETAGGEIKIDLSDYYTKEETEAKIEEAIEGIELPEQQEVDLTGYAKKTDIPDISGKADKEHTHSEYLTQHQDLSAYALKTDIPVVPDVSNFTTEEEVNTLINTALGVIENGSY